jgi:serine/threonine-protein kinase
MESMGSSHELQAGEVVAGRFRVVARLGAGGMGAVYRAVQQSLEREVALKVAFGSDRTDGGVARERFLREARTLASIRHPSVVTIHDFGATDDGALFYTMELVEGESLLQRLRGLGRLNPDAARKIVRGIAEALEVTHAAGIVHRDLKPANVMLSGDVVTLVDFGLARRSGQSAESTAPLTATGAVLGTVGYMAPEVIEQRASDDPRLDLYALGVLWFELVTGRRPFEGDTDLGVLFQHVSDPPPRPSDLVEGLDLPESDERIMLGLMAKHPDERPASARDLLGQLQSSGHAEEIDAGPDLEPRGTHLPPQPIRPAGRSAGVSTDVPAIAVLPFACHVADPEHTYLGDGLADLLTSMLAQRGALRVVSRTSASRFKDSSLSLTEIGRRLGVDCIVEGTVLAAGDGYQVSIQLIDARSDTHLWACSHERGMEHLFAMLSEVASAIGHQLRGADEPDGALQAVLEQQEQQVQPDAFKAYLRAQHLWSLRDASSLRGAEDLYREAIKLDPCFVPAHCGVVHTRIVLALYGVDPPSEAVRACRGNLEQAVGLAPNLPAVKLAQAGVALFFDWDFTAAWRLVEDLLAVGPGEPLLHLACSDLLTINGRLEAAVEAMRRAVRLDPYDPGMNMNLAERLFAAGDHEEALARYQGILDMIPGFVPCLVRMAPCHSTLGQHEKALSLLARLPPYSDDASVLTCRAVVTARAGQIEDARSFSARLVELSSRRYTPACQLARVDVSLGDHEGAMTWLERGYANRDPMLLFAGGDHLLRPLHRRPEYPDLLDRVGVDVVAPYAGPRPGSKAT